MLRTPLQQGNSIQLNNRQYTIKAPIGYGATCIVYSAYYVDSVEKSHDVCLKEYYPHNAAISREQQNLIWGVESERESALASFRNTYDKLISWQNENFAVGVFDLCEGNNTLYIVMNADKGITFDKDHTVSLNDILKTVKLLAHFVGKYHENGYLHLDIKPSNFLVYPRPSEHIVLFDMDSVAPIADIENGVAKCISYSDDWAAPEQKQRKFDQLCPATDIFAIGAILFEKVMGRTVTAFDMGVFADWDFEGEMFDEVNPEIRVILKKVFKNTLAASAKRRYQATCELEEDLDRAIKILTAGEPYLLPEHIPCTANFVGRQNELNAIEQAFASGSHIVCLKGMGGIGKSELARKYAQNYNSDETPAVFVSYRGKDSIEEMLDDIEVQNFTGSDKEKLKHLKKLLNKSILLVVDELESEDVPDLDILEGLKCRILLTSRLAWDEYGSFSTIPVSNLRDDEQVELFTREYGSDLSVDEIAIIHEIFAMMEGHTLVISLLAKQMRKGLQSFEEVLQRIHSDGLKSVSDGKIRHMKDSSRPLSGSVYSILRTILNIADFSEDEIYIMRSLSILRGYQIDQCTFISMIGNKYAEQIDDLCFEGWVIRSTKKNSKTLELHSLIAELCCDSLEPNFVNCHGVADYFRGIAEHVSLFQGIYDPKFDVFESEVKAILMFLNNLKYSEINLKYSIELLYTMVNGNVEIFTWFGSVQFTIIAKKINAVLGAISSDKWTLFRALSIIETAWCSENPPIFEEEKAKNDANLPLVWNRMYSLIVSEDYDFDKYRADAFEMAISAAIFVPDNLRSAAIYKAFLPAICCICAGIEFYEDLGSCDFRKVAAKVIEYSYLLQEEAYDDGFNDKLQKVKDYASYWDKLDEEYDEVLDEKDRLLTAEENREFAQEMIEIMKGPSPGKLREILNNNELSDIEKAHKISFSQPFRTWFHHTEDCNANRWIEETNWTYLDEALEIQSELLWNCREEWSDGDERLFGIVAAKRAIVWAILDESDLFDEQLEMLFSKYLNDMDECDIDKAASTRHMSETYFGYVVNAMRCINRTHWILVHMLDYLKHIEGRFIITGEYSQQDLFEYYDLLCDILDETILEIGDRDHAFSRLRDDFKAIIDPDEGIHDFLFPKD